MDASTIVKKIYQQLNEYEEPNAVKKEPGEPLAVKFHFSRPDSSMKIDIDSGFKVLENNILEIRNNKNIGCSIRVTLLRSRLGRAVVYKRNSDLYG